MPVSNSTPPELSTPFPLRTFIPPLVEDVESDSIKIAPLDSCSLDPEEIRIDPPVEDELPPAFNIISALFSPDTDVPVAIATEPAIPSSDPPVVNKMSPLESNECPVDIPTEPDKIVDEADAILMLPLEPSLLPPDSKLISPPSPAIE